MRMSSIQTGQTCRSVDANTIAGGEPVKVFRITGNVQRRPGLRRRIETLPKQKLQATRGIQRDIGLLAQRFAESNRGGK